jgi:simple sugar transport system permease protein
MGLPETISRWLRMAPPATAGRAARARDHLLEPAAMVLGVGMVVLALAAMGYSLGDVLRALWDGSLGTRYAIENSLGNAIPLALVGASVWVAYVAGLFNIGGEGQLQWGGLAGVVVTLALQETSPVLAVVAGLVCGVLAGALWAGIAGLLKVARGGSEVISTIMLTYTAVLLVNYLVNGPLKDPTDFSAATRQTERAAQVDVVLAAVVTAVVVLVTVGVVRGTGLGITMRATGASTRAALIAGLPVKRVWLLTMLLSGGLAGLAGAMEIVAVQHRVSAGWSLNWGLLGIVVAFLSMRRPWLMIAWAAVFGMLQATGPTLKADASVPDAAVTVMLIAPLAAYFVLRWLLESQERRRFRPELAT